MGIVTKEQDTKEAACGWAAYMDAERINNENMSSYTWQERSEAQKVRDLLDLAYAGNIFINYRKTFIAVKVESPLIKDRKMAREIDDIFGEKGMEKLITKQGVVYRISRMKKGK